MSFLEDIINHLRLQVTIYHNSRACGNWIIDKEKLGASCFHLLTQGGCVINVPAHGTWQLSEGDIVLFPKELPHTLYPSEPHPDTERHLPLYSSQDITGTSILCGAIDFNHAGATYLIQLLPPILILRAEDTQEWLSPLTQLILHESLAGASIKNAVLNRLSEVLIACTLRCYTEQDIGEKQGVFALYSHPQLFHAIRAIHAQPAKQWSLESLAKEAGMSRTRFSESFKSAANMTATDYLTWWRMQLAWTELVEGNSVANVADTVGYRSEAAFARAFKRTFGETVGSVRARNRHT